MDELAGLLNSALLLSALSFGGSTVLLLIEHLRNRSKTENYFLVGLLVYVIPALLGYVMDGEGWLIVLYVLLSFASFTLAYPPLENFTATVNCVSRRPDARSNDATAT